MLKAIKPIIATDLDGVVANNSPYLEFINDQLGTNIRPRDCHSFEPTDCFGIDLETYVQIHSRFVAQGGYAKLLPNPEALTTLGNLQTHFEVAIVTARIDEVFEETECWCARHLPGSTVFYGQGAGNAVAGGNGRAKKVDIATDIGAVCLVEDNPNEFFDWPESSVEPICYPQPWNKSLETSHPHIPRLTWPEIGRLLNWRFTYF